MGTRTLQDALDLFRIVIGRRNPNDPDAADNKLIRYLNDFVSLSMPNDTKLIESFGTMTFTIDENKIPNDGVYTFNEVGADAQFINISQEAYVSLLEPENNSVSWNRLPIYQDPGEFFEIWGVNNYEILIPGYPTAMLYYGNEFTFRTIPDTAYQIKIFGYKKNEDYASDGEVISPSDVDLQYDYWLRYIVYGSAVNYARDYRYDGSDRAMIEATFKSERKLQLTHTHNQIKLSRAMPRF